MPASGFSDSFVAGEIFADAQDRDDVVAIAKGIQLGQNLIVQTTGPLKKRRGFWYLGASLAGSAKLGRLIPFRKSQQDALMLEFGDGVAKVWQANGSPLTSGGSPVTFSTPYAAGQLASLRYRQVQDVIYFFDATGATAPTTLTRTTDTSWAFANPLTFRNGPWLPENDDQGFTIAVSGGTYQTDANPTGYGAVATTAGTVALTASEALFEAGMVGSQMRIRVGTGAPSMRSWFAGYYIPVGWFVESVGNVYECTATAGSAQQSSMSTPPVQTVPGELQNDGCNTWAYLHDGAGIVEITAVASATSATATVVSTLPIGNGQTTEAWALAAYSADSGWPQCWPSAIEERFVTGATAANPDFIDLTETAGFTPSYLDYHPGQGTGNVIATDALRARLGDDGGQILWTYHSTFLFAGTTSGEYVITGGLFSEPISNTTATYRKISNYGSADLYPAELEKGLCFCAVGAENLRWMKMDAQQGLDTDDYSFLAHHIELRQFEQLRWIKQPDRILWSRMGDGGLAALTVHEEQQVKGWTTQALATPAAGAPTVEDIVSIPGPGGYETLWMLVSGTLGGTASRWLMMASQVSDGLFMDFANSYSGVATTTIGGLAYLDGESVTVFAAGVSLGAFTVSGGEVTLPQAVTTALVGLTWLVDFQSLKLDIQTLGGTLNQRQRVTKAVVDLYGVGATVGLLGAALQETRRPPGWAMTPAPQRWQAEIFFAGDAGRDPRIQLTEQSPYDFGIFALRPIVVAEAPPRG